MGVEQMREAIADAYLSETWKRKVSNMPEDQVMAIYFKFKEAGKLDRPPAKPKKKYVSPRIDVVQNEPVQLTIYDLLEGRC